MTVSKEKRNLILAGTVIGIISAVLVLLGNPKNMGFCIACFIRDTAGALSLHSASVVQYARPEVRGLLLGSMIISLAKGEFKPRGGSSPFIRFVISFFVMIGALVFLGCPFRMLLRLSGGDLNALVGLFGFAAGIVVGSMLLNKGFSLGRSYKQSKAEGSAIGFATLALLAVLLFIPALLKFSEKGPGSLHAPILLALAGGLVVGILSQRNRFCMAGGIRDLFLFRDSTLALGSLFVFLSALVLNLVTGDFHLSFANQPVAHTDWLWNFLGMGLVGYGSTLIGGCPLRQTILAGEGSSDSAMSVMGMLVGAAFAHNFALASSATGATNNGKISVVVGFVVVSLIAASVMHKAKNK
jgi:YedE family putative selenium metabolism protein